jgi:Co/Zn/Cd efflux system component
MKVTNGKSSSPTQYWLSNINILRAATLLFGMFVVSEIIGALASGALSLLGDGVAMGIDVLTYMANMYAEHIKSHHGFISFRLRILLEIGIPTFAICSLLAVTGWITSDAIAVLQNPKDSNDVSLAYLYGFSAANAFVDILTNMIFYYRGKNVFYQDFEEAFFTKVEPHTHEIGGLPVGGLGTDRSHIAGIESDHSHAIEVEMVNCATKTETSTSNKNLGEGIFVKIDGNQTADPKLLNLNMVSAFTHVGADTLRTTSVT